LATDGDHIPGYQLPTAPLFQLTVHLDVAVGEQLLGIRALFDEVGQLEQLSEPDATATDADPSHQPILLAGRSGWLLIPLAAHPAGCSSRWLARSRWLPEPVGWSGRLAGKIAA